METTTAVMPETTPVNTKRWYVVHAFSGFEKSVQRALVDRIARSDFAAQFGQVLVPVE